MGRGTSLGRHFKGGIFQKHSFFQGFLQAFLAKVFLEWPTFLAGFHRIGFFSQLQGRSLPNLGKGGERKFSRAFFQFIVGRGNCPFGGLFFRVNCRKWVTLGVKRSLGLEGNWPFGRERPYMLSILTFFSPLSFWGRGNGTKGPPKNYGGGVFQTNGGL